jgi:DNA-binding transcriptional ArsR family regulator
VLADVDISPVAALLGDPARAAMLSALHDGRALPAGELARRARVGASTASEHLSRLVDGGLLTVERTGRHRYFRLASAEVAHACEALAAVAPARRVRSLREATIGSALARARLCYDHLAGQLGVAVTGALLDRRALVDEGDRLTTGPALEETLELLGVALSPSRRPTALRCIDWSERRPHVAGALGAALARRALDDGWVEQRRESRALRITGRGAQAFESLLGVALTPSRDDERPR